MIHTRLSLNSERKLDGVHISVTEDSLPNFIALINRALNTWDSAPAELKELGDKLTHGHVLQEYK